MTTIAYDGKTLACDMQVTTGEMKSKVRKMIVLDEERVCCYAGTVDDCLQLLTAYMNGTELTVSEGFCATLVIFNTVTKRCFIMHEKMHELEVLAPFAYGSGQLAALACLKLGKNAVKSIEIASQCDINTGLGVMYWDNKTKCISEIDLT